ncbi:hypothetical protein [Aliiroseovarius sp. 2305UL8-7]|uniref:hypothetical protein n=1 Tax=Aliiroseovarius conchicola TaxID=3121637 RepID=UPI0035296773
MMGLGYDIPALAMRRQAGSGSAPFSPLALSPSAFFDPWRSETMFQDPAGFLSASADGQPIGLWQDLSDAGNDLSQAISAARPTYRTDGTDHWIEMDGVDDAMKTADIFDVENPITMVLGYQMLSTSGTSRVNVAEISKTSTNGMSIGARPNIDRLQYYSRMSQNGVSASNLASPSIWGGHARHVVSLRAVPSHVTVRMDGVPVIDTAQLLTTQSVASQPLRIGLGKVTGSIPGAFRLFGLQVWASQAAQPDTIQLDMLEQWMADRIGVTL